MQILILGSFKVNVYLLLGVSRYSEMNLKCRATDLDKVDLYLAHCFH